MSMEDFFWLTALPFWAGFIVLMIIIPIFVYLFWKKWMPPVSKFLFWCARHKQIPLLLCHDSGRARLLSIMERRAEGIVVTNDGKYKILPRYMPREPFEEKPKQTEPAQEGSDSQENSQKSFDIDQKFVKTYGDWVLKRNNLIGLGLPFFVGYTGKLCLLSPETLALYEAGEMAIETEEGKLFNLKKLKGLSDLEKDKKIQSALQPLLLLDPRKIGQIIYQGFDQSQINALIEDARESERLRKGRFSPKIILAIIVIVIVAVAALYFLPKLFGG